MAIVHEGLNGVGFFADRVGGVRRPVGAAIAGQIERIDAVMIADQLRHQTGPVIRASAQTVDQHDRIAGATGVIVDPHPSDARQFDVREVAVNSGNEEPNPGCHTRAGSEGE